MKINVAITTGYLISGKSVLFFKDLFMVEGLGHIDDAFFPPLLFFYLCLPDLLLIFYYWKAIGDKFFVVHHLAALYAYYYVLVSALLSNSRTCRQDGKETTKGEQLCPI